MCLGIGEKGAVQSEAGVMLVMSKLGEAKTSAAMPRRTCHPGNIRAMRPVHIFKNKLIREWDRDTVRVGHRNRQNLHVHQRWYSGVRVPAPAFAGSKILAKYCYQGGDPISTMDSAFSSMNRGPAFLNFNTCL